MTVVKRTKKEINHSKYILSNYDEIIGLINCGKYFSSIVEHLNNKLETEGIKDKITENTLRTAMHRIKNNSLKPVNYKNVKNIDSPVTPILISENNLDVSEVSETKIKPIKEVKPRWDHSSEDPNKKLVYEIKK